MDLKILPRDLENIIYNYLHQLRMNKLMKVIKTMEEKIFYCGEDCDCFTVKKTFIENNKKLIFEIDELELDKFERLI